MANNAYLIGLIRRGPSERLARQIAIDALNGFKAELDSTYDRMKATKYAKHPSVEEALEKIANAIDALDEAIDDIV